MAKLGTKLKFKITGMAELGKAVNELKNNLNDTKRAFENAKLDFDKIDKLVDEVTIEVIDDADNTSTEENVEIAEKYCLTFKECVEMANFAKSYRSSTNTTVAVTTWLNDSFVLKNK